MLGHTDITSVHHQRFDAHDDMDLDIVCNHVQYENDVVFYVSMILCVGSQLKHELVNETNWNDFILKRTENL